MFHVDIKNIEMGDERIFFNGSEFKSSDAMTLVDNTFIF